MIFIINPVAGRDRAKKIVPVIEEMMGEANKDYKIVYTKEPREAITLTKQAIIEGFTIIVAVGGDGTINEVTEGIIESSNKVNLGIIPGGTGNDLAKGLDIPMDPREALRIILKGNVKRIDTGRIGDKIFLNVASVGFDAEVVKNTVQIKKYFKGRFAYTISLIRTLFIYKTKKVKIELDDKEIEGNVFLLAIANGKYYGGGMKIAPMAIVDDGYFHICIVEKMSRVKILFIFPLIFKGNHASLKEVEFYKSKQVKVITSQPVYINIDGEIVKVKDEITFNVSDKKINVITELDA